jgi:hypothetical protein
MRPSWARKPACLGVSRDIQRSFTCAYLYDAMKNRLLQYYMHDGPTASRIELAGNLDCEAALRLDQDWRTDSSAIGDRKLIVDMTFVTNLAEEGKTLLRRWHQEGASLIANSTTSRVAESVLGGPLPANTTETIVSHRTWLPFHASFLVSPVILFVLAVIALSSQAKPATLRPETAAAWDDYLQMTTANLQDRIRDWTPDGRTRRARFSRRNRTMLSRTISNAARRGRREA